MTVLSFQTGAGGDIIHTRPPIWVRESGGGGGGERERERERERMNE